MNRDNIALLVIDGQNKYKCLMTKKEIQHMKTLVQYFRDKKKPVYFTQWSRCKTKYNCTRNHKKETIMNKISFDQNWLNFYRREKTKKFKCPGKQCDIVDELKSFSNRNNTFISNNMDSLMNRKLRNIIKKKRINHLYLVGGWGSHCILSTAYGCINHYNIMPHIVKDAVFDMKRYKKAIHIVTESVIPGCTTKEVIENL